MVPSILEVSKLEDRLARLEQSISQASPDLNHQNDTQSPSNQGSSIDQPPASKLF